MITSIRKEKLDIVEEMAESYRNGNITVVKKWLKKTSKNNLMIFIDLLAGYYVHKYSEAVDTVKRLLQ